MKKPKVTFITISLPEKYKYLAQDGSEIRLLAEASLGGLCHCTLPVGVSRPVAHKTVEEIWYFLSGEGEVWRKNDEEEQIVEVKSGVSLTIPTGVRFQFRNTGEEPLCFLITTMPRWDPNADEIIFFEKGLW